MAQHTLIALLHDRPGVLHRTVTLLRRRGFNIVSLAVGRAEVPGISRMTLVVDAQDATPVVQQLDRLVEVIAVSAAETDSAIHRETAMMKIVAPAERLAAIADEALAAGARIIELAASEVILEMTDIPERVEAFIAAMKPRGIAELVRTGRLAMMRGPAARPLETPENFRDQADGAPSEEAA
jgi:acetolactate synthase-1/3 small subunit